MLVLYALCLTDLAQAQQNTPDTRDNSLLTNVDIIRMTRSKFDDATIIKTIQAFNTDIDVSVAALLELKEAGVTQTVIQAMLAKVTDESKPHSPDEHSTSAASPRASQVASSRPQEPVAGSGTTPTNPYPHPTSRHEGPGEANEPARPSRPRVYLESVSSGSNKNAARDQSMEMAKDFLKVCSDVKITINQSAANYTIRLNHIEHGLLYRDNQIEVFDSNGDLMRNKEGGSIKKNVQQVCDLIYADWTQQAN
jgi:hypothetical protein